MVLAPRADVAIRRLHDWEPRLRVFLAGAALKPFEWGEHDCSLFAAGAVEAMTGTDLAAGFRGRYDSAQGALRVLRAAGAETPEDIARTALKPCTLRARPGDVAIVEADPWPALGIVQGAGIYVTGAGGLYIAPRSVAFRFYVVPF